MPFYFPEDPSRYQDPQYPHRGGAPAKFGDTFPQLIPTWQQVFGVEEQDSYSRLEELFGFVGIPGIIEIRFKQGAEWNFGPLLKSFIEIVHFESIDGIDESNLDYLDTWSTKIPNISVKIFGIDLSMWFPIEGSERITGDGKPTTWLRVLVSFLATFLFVVITLVLGTQFAGKLVAALPWAVSGAMNIQSARLQAEFRNMVKEKLDYLIYLLEEGDLSKLYKVVMQVVSIMMGKLAFI